MTLTMLCPLITASSHTLTLMLDFVTTSCSPPGEQLPSGIEDILTCKLKVTPGLWSMRIYFSFWGLAVRMKLCLAVEFVCLTLYYLLVSSSIYSSTYLLICAVRGSVKLVIYFNSCSSNPNNLYLFNSSNTNRAAFQPFPEFHCTYAPPHTTSSPHAYSPGSTIEL